MIRNRREIIIGVMLEDISSDFSKELIKSVVNAIPVNRNVRLAVFPGKYDDRKNTDKLHEYREVHNSIFAMGEQCGFDGIIFHLGSVRNDPGDSFYRHCMECFGDIPKVFIGRNDPELVTVNYDNESGIREAINYLVNVSGITRLCMLGGREDNQDACIRKDLFRKCLEEYGLAYSDTMFVNSDMSFVCTEDAAHLLDMNPDAQAIFCVNDAAAKALYTVMHERRIVPGRDVMVFAFDNTNMSGELVPTLSSIGSYGTTLGEKALDLVLDMINGIEVNSALVPTRLFGRESMPYAMYDYNTLEMVNADQSFIYRMFDDCFYRYKSSHRGREEIDLRRLYYEFISKMLLAMKHRYMSIETFDELCRLIDIFFDNGAMRYTDVAKLLRSVEMLQDAMNESQVSAVSNVQNNRLFLRMKDKALFAVAKELASQRNAQFDETLALHQFMADSMGYEDSSEKRYERVLKSIGRFTLRNAALYLFDNPVRFKSESFGGFPQYIRLACIVRDELVHVIPNARQRCRLDEIFLKNELPAKGGGFLAFPVFHADRIYGVLLCEPFGDIYDRGECVALQLGRAFYLIDADKVVRESDG